MGRIKQGQAAWHLVKILIWLLNARSVRNEKSSIVELVLEKPLDLLGTWLIWVDDHAILEDLSPSGLTFHHIPRLTNTDGYGREVDLLIRSEFFSFFFLIFLTLGGAFVICSDLRLFIETDYSRFKKSKWKIWAETPRGLCALKSEPKVVKFVKFSSFETIEPVVHSSKEVVRIINIYITWQGFLDELSGLLSHHTTSSGRLIIMGDMNIHVHNKEDSKTKQIGDLLYWLLIIWLSLLKSQLIISYSWQHIGHYICVFGMEMMKLVQTQLMLFRRVSFLIMHRSILQPLSRSLSPL